MSNYIIRKILTLIPMMLVISFLIYLGMELMPGDAVDFLIPPDALSTMSPEQLNAMRDALGLNDPFFLRYLKWLAGLVRGDFGYSLQSGVPVLTLMKNHLPATIELTLTSLVMSSIFGILLGVVCALKKGTALDQILSVVGMVGVAIPQFLLGLICINAFALHTSILPVGGRMAYAGQNFIQRLPYLIMPATVLGFSLTSGVMRYGRSSMLDSMGLYENGQEQGTAGVACEPAARPQGRHDAGGSAHWIPPAHAHRRRRGGGGGIPVAGNRRIVCGCGPFPEHAPGNDYWFFQRPVGIGGQYCGGYHYRAAGSAY